LPSDATAGLPDPFTVTYSDFGYRNAEDPSTENVLLYLGPLLCTRYFPSSKDRYAREHRVRIISVDRPGFGETTAVPVEDRVKAWLGMPDQSSRLV
jgi:pimeloyl-ACP methyl ester carboxylesterase